MVLPVTRITNLEICGLDKYTPRTAPPAVGAELLLQQEVPHEHRVDAGGVEAPHRVARCAHQRIAEQIEGRVVEHRQAGGLSLGVQELPLFQRRASGRATAARHLTS